MRATGHEESAARKDYSAEHVDMRLRLALVCVTVLGYVGAEDKDCPKLDCKKEGNNCTVVRDDGSQCGRCSCRGKQSSSSDSKPEGESGSEPSGEDTRNSSTAAAVAENTSENKPEAASKTDDKSHSKPDGAAQSSEGAGVAASSDHSPCDSCPEHCMITMYRGKCTGCVLVDDAERECH
nr:uncharacterized protein LOC126533890 [Dermacentor andersoni]